MDRFSQEFKEQLIAEHKLVSASIGHLFVGEHYHRFARVHGNDSVAMAVQNLRARKIELEAQIDVLTEYLN